MSGALELHDMYAENVSVTFMIAYTAIMNQRYSFFMRTNWFLTFYPCIFVCVLTAAYFSLDARLQFFFLPQ